MASFLAPADSEIFFAIGSVCVSLSCLCAYLCVCVCVCVCVIEIYDLENPSALFNDLPMFGWNNMRTMDWAYTSLWQQGQHKTEADGEVFCAPPANPSSGRRHWTTTKTRIEQIF